MTTNAGLNNSSGGHNASRRKGWLALIGTLCIWSGFILASRAAGKGTLTAWDVTALRLAMGGLLAWFFFVACHAAAVESHAAVCAAGRHRLCVLHLFRFSSGASRARGDFGSRQPAFIHSSSDLAIVEKIAKPTPDDGTAWDASGYHTDFDG